MSIQVLGAAATYVQAVEQGGTWFLSPTQPLTALSDGQQIAGTLRETLAGYSPSTRDTPFALTARAGGAGLPAGVEQARLISHGVNDTVIQTYAARMDPRDRVPYFQKFTGLLNGAAIARIVSVNVDVNASALGLRPILTGALQPQVLPGDIVMAWLEVASDRYEDPSFNRPLAARLECEIESNADPFKRFQRSGNVMLEQK